MMKLLARHVGLMLIFGVGRGDQTRELLAEVSETLRTCAPPYSITIKRGFTVTSLELHYPKEGEQDNAG